MLCLSGFELYSRWVPLKIERLDQSRLQKSDPWLCVLGRKHRHALKHDITLLAVQYSKTEITKEKIESGCASRKPVTEYLL